MPDIFDNTVRRRKRNVSEHVPLFMTTNLLTSDPAVALELGRRLAMNARRQPKLRHRWGAALSRMFSGRVPVVKPVRGRA